MTSGIAFQTCSAQLAVIVSRLHQFRWACRDWSRDRAFREVVTLHLGDRGLAPDGAAMNPIMVRSRSE
jgi:hypothetical protein